MAIFRWPLRLFRLSISIKILDLAIFWGALPNGRGNIIAIIFVVA
jgi:hypothetical protein